MKTPNITVVVCTHNRADSLGDALRSLEGLEHGGRFSYEVLVVDNASTDHTWNVVTELRQRRPGLVRSVYEPQKGIVAARNCGVREARGEWIAFFDDDQIADPSWLAELMHTAGERRVRCVGGAVTLRLPAENNRDLAPECRMLLGETPPIDHPQPYSPWFTPGAGNLMVHRSVFDEIGLFDEFRMNRGEDTELSLRMHRAGIKGWFTPWAVVHHVIPSERLTDKYLLQVARVMARGMAEDERATWGTAAFPFVWLARLGQLVGHFFPMWLWYRLCREGERAFGVRCRIEIARRHLADGFGLLLRADKRREESGRQAAEGRRQKAAGRQFCRRTKSAADIEGGQDGTRRRNSLEQGITLVRPGQLSPVQLQQWSELADRQPDLSSPCFRPEFTLAVNEVRRDVEVAVVSTMGRAVAFFPFQRGRWKTGRPVGATLSDFQGVISEPGVNISQADLLRGCRLSGWKFDHLLLSQSVFAAGSSHRSQSPFIDISCGYEAYRSQLKQAGSRQLEQIERKLRKMEREAGPVRFEAHTNDPHVLRQLFDWKSQQYRRTGARDVFARQWPRDLLRRTLEFHEPAFSGMLSALYVGDKLAAVHFGMRSHGVLHWWFPAYNGEFHQYSPGLLLLLSLLTRADVLGITRIDLGKGDERYKLSLMTGSVSVGEGYASHSSWRSAVRATVNGSREWLRGSCLYRPARRSISCFRSIGNRVPFIEG